LSGNWGEIGKKCLGSPKWNEGIVVINHALGSYVLHDNLCVNFIDKSFSISFLNEWINVVFGKADGQAKRRDAARARDSAPPAWLAA
jgi:hypothetical protein